MKGPTVTHCGYWTDIAANARRRMPSWWTANYFMFYSMKRPERTHLAENAKKLRGFVLDLGCGSRPFRDLLPSGHIGADRSPQRGVDVCADAERLPFATDAFDGVLCNQLLEHVPHPQIVLQEIGRVMKASGTAYIAVPTQWYLHYEPHDFFRFTDHGLRVVLEENGFIVDSIDRMGGLPTYLLDRLIEAVARRLLQNSSSHLGSSARRVLIVAIGAVHAVLFQLVRPLDRLSPRDVIFIAAVVHLPLAETECGPES